MFNVSFVAITMKSKETKEWARMKFSSPDKYSIYSELKKLELNEKERDKSIREFVEKLYREKQIETLISLHSFADPGNNFLIKHNYLDWNGQGNPILEFYLTYNENKKRMEKGESVTESHVQIDIDFIKMYAEKFIELQEELKEFEDGISKANTINHRIANFYNEQTELDAQNVFAFHSKLYEDAAEELFLEEDHGEYAKEFLNMDNIKSISSFAEFEPLTEDEINKSTEKIVERILVLQKKMKLPEKMPLFDLKKHKEMEKILEDEKSMMKIRADGKNIAMFAGDKTNLLEERLSEVNLKIGEPIRNPKNGIWHYTISDSSSFRGLVYRDFIEYVNEIFGEIGKIPRCNVCDSVVIPSSQQLRKLKERKNIYCQDKDCAEKGRISKQNEKRKSERLLKKEAHNEKDKVREKKNDLEESEFEDRKVLDFSVHQLNKHLNGEKNLSIEEQGQIIQQKINQTIKKGSENK